ncbi:MAG: 2-C-methyl-D-erythritol 2,4-cyclodiphosphate synthase [Bacteroidales bacterium]|nr:2-C-methyl-D-erythritol 2,4-cyclodiphosphate synthase [Bacteroidales bacterium]
MDFRIGFGYDVHQLAAGRKLILGGVEIPSEKGPVAHSDGDVLIHAICDALLGAAGLRDIGFHFPDNESEFKGISSMIILQKTLNLLKECQYKVGNIDTTICLQQPKIRDYVGIIKENLASAIKTGTDNISVKATTAEHLGFVGKGKGIAAYAVVLISRDG